MEFLAKINDPVLLALASTCFTWFMTALGAGMVFFFKEINKRVLNMMLGFAAGIMVAASFWSLLEPAIEMAQSAPIPAWLVAAIGFVGGWRRGLFVPGRPRYAACPLLCQRGADGRHTDAFKTQYSFGIQHNAA